MAQTETRTLSIVARLVDGISRPAGVAGRAIGGFARLTQTQMRGATAAFASARTAVLGLVAAYAGLRGVDTIKGVAEDAASLQRLSVSVGDTVRNLSDLRGALRLAGIESGGFESSVRELVKLQSDAAQGNAKTIDSFRALGITLQELTTLSPAQLFERITQGLESFGTQQERTIAFAKRLPDALAPLLPILVGGVDRFRDLVQQAREVGSSVTAGEAGASEQLTRSFAKVQLALESLSRAMIEAFGPDVSAVLTKVAKLIAENRQVVVDLAAAIGNGLVTAIDVAIKALIGLVEVIEKIPGVHLVDQTSLRVDKASLESSLKDIADLQAGVKFPPIIELIVKDLAKHEPELRERLANVNAQLADGIAGSMRRAVEQVKKELAAIRSSAGDAATTAKSPDETAAALGLPSTSDWADYAKAMDQAMRPGGRSIFETPTRSAAPPRDRSDDQVVGRERERLAIMQQLAGLGPDLEQVRRAQEEVGRLSLVLSLQEAKDKGVINAQELAEALDKVNTSFAALHSVAPRGDFFEGFDAGARDAIQQWQNFGAAGREAATTIIDGGLNNLTDNLSAVLLNTKSAKVAFRAFASSVVSDIARVIVKLLIMQAIMAATSFGATATAGQASAFGIAGIGFEKGGTTDRQVAGTIPLRRFESGGVVRGPTLALFGEGRASRGEAFVPLPDGRRIPVALMGGGGGGANVTINIQAMDGADAQRVLMSQADTIRTIWSEGAGRIGAVRQQIRGAAR